MIKGKPHTFFVVHRSTAHKGSYYSIVECLGNKANKETLLCFCFHFVMVGNHQGSPQTILRAVESYMLCLSRESPHHRWIVKNNKHVSLVPFSFPDSQSVIFCTYQNRGVTHASWHALSHLEFVVKATDLKLNLLNLKSTTCFAENLTNLILMSQVKRKFKRFKQNHFFPWTPFNWLSTNILIVFLVCLSREWLRLF